MMVLAKLPKAALVAVSLCLVYVSIGEAAGGALSDSTDTLWRAAFCAGALKNARENLTTSITAKSVLCDDGRWQRDNFSSVEACIVDARKVGDAMLAKKQKRYSGYIALHLLGPTDGSFPQIAIMEKRGETAARTTRETNDGLEERCAKECAGVTMPPGQDRYDDCLIPCIERTDQERANVLRCVMSPDRLPF